jgi:hypothetical protein
MKYVVLADIGELAKTSTTRRRQHPIHHCRRETEIVAGRGQALDGGAVDP